MLHKFKKIMDKLKNNCKIFDEPEDVLLDKKEDRRLLPHVPDPRHERIVQRRGANAEGDDFNSRFPGQRYRSNFKVRISLDGTKSISGLCTDISQTGMMLKFKDGTDLSLYEKESVYSLKFEIPDGTMLEGMEKKYHIRAKYVRTDQEQNSCAFEFVEPLHRFISKRKDRYIFTMAALFLLAVSFFVVLLRVESILYFRFHKLLYLYSIMTATFLLSRYLFGLLYKPMPIDPNFTPAVTIIIPCFNEEEWIQRTILSCMDQMYPVDKLEVIVVDDCSKDKSLEKIKEIIDLLYQTEDRYLTKERISYVKQPENKGKREAMAVGVKLAKHDLVVFVDSDSFLEPDAVVNLVQPFCDPKVAGVSGRTDIANTFTNQLTKMQTVRYYVSFRIMKAAESFFDSVMCLSGPLACYRKSEVMKNLKDWLDQRFLGQRATFGDDRSLTNMMVKNNHTCYQDTAVCSTIVPNKHKVFLKQQMRWKRSWLRESFVASKFMWKKEPIMAVFFYIGLLVPILSPVIVTYNLIYVPIVHRIFPTTFLVGMLAMALLMSFAQLLLRKSKTWLYGMWFCLYYEFILLWQMPWAWLTFWVSTWGTRMTPQDEEAKIRKEEKARLHEQKKQARKSKKTQKSD